MVLSSFSFVKNSKKILFGKISDDTFGCLNGLRVISLAWIILSHRYINSTFFPTINGLDILEGAKTWSASMIIGAPMAVDTFFTISGFLVFHLYFKGRAKGGNKIFIPTYYAHRLLRLTPALAVVVLISATLVKYLGDGPFWPAIEQFFQKSCESNWWSTLIYLQNYLHTNQQCVGQTWYIAVDTQLYILSPFILILLEKFPKVAISSMLISIFLALGYIFETTYKNNLGSTFFEQDHTFTKLLYTGVHTRFPPWLIGGFFGYLINKRAFKKFKLNRILVLALWVFAIGILFGIMISHTAFIKYEYDVWKSATFNTFAKPFWALAVCIAITLCISGCGGWINDFLSIKVFAILNRINYSAYLVHLLVISYFMGLERTPVYFNRTIEYHHFWGDFVFTQIVAFVWTVLFESPVVNLEKFLFKRKPRTNRTANGNIEDNGPQDQTAVENNDITIRVDANEVPPVSENLDDIKMNNTPK